MTSSIIWQAFEKSINQVVSGFIGRHTDTAVGAIMQLDHLKPSNATEF